MIEEAFLPVLKTLDNAPTTSPLSQVNIENVIELLLQLTDINNLVQLDKNKTNLSSPALNQFVCNFLFYIIFHVFFIN